MVSKREVKEALKRVIDPEVGFNIVEMGLIYRIELKRAKGVGESKKDVLVQMTLTSPGCPLAPTIEGMVKMEVGKIEGVGRVDLELVWDPPWTPEMMTEEVKAELGM